MNTTPDERSKAQRRAVCTHPAVRGLLHDYVTDLLEDAAAEEFEEHLLDCLYCREEYLKVLGIRAAKPATETAPADEAARAPEGAKVLSFADFRKEPS